MDSHALACPYCNTLLADSAAPVDEPRITCPRCGESFPNRQFSGTVPVAERRVEEERTATPAHTNPRVAGYLLAFMGLVALGALAFMLWTKGFRERISLGGKKDQGTLVEERYSPAELPGLGFLPEATSIVAGVHVAELAGDPKAKEAFDSLRTGPLKMAFERLKDWTGLEAEAIDHVVLGLGGGSKANGDNGGLQLPQLTVVVRTRRPYRPEAIAQAVQPAKPVKYHQRPLYKLPVKPLGQAYLWCVEERTLVLVVRVDGVKKQDLEAIPPAPRKAALAGPLEKVMRERLPRDAAFWLAGHMEEPHPLLALAGLWRFAAAADRAATLDAFAVGAVVREDVTVLGSLRCKTVADASRLQLALQTEAAGKIPSLRILGPASPLLAGGAGSMALLQAASPGAASVTVAAPLLAAQAHFQASGDPTDTWLVLQWRIAGDQIPQLVR
jgi:hypothetical protein